MNSLHPNRHADTVLKTMLSYAIIHTTIMIVYTVVSGDYQTLNSFRILGLQLFFPTIDDTPFSFWISHGILLATAGVVYNRFTKKQ